MKVYTGTAKFLLMGVQTWYFLGVVNFQFLKYSKLGSRSSCWIKVIQGQLRLVRGQVKYVGVHRHRQILPHGCTDMILFGCCQFSIFKIFEIRFKVILLIQGHPGSSKTCEGAGQVWGFTQAPPKCECLTIVGILISEISYSCIYSNNVLFHHHFKSDILMKFSLFFLSGADTWLVHVVEFCTSELFPSSILLPFNQHVIFD